MERFTRDGLSIVWKVSDDKGLQMIWLGTSDARDPAEFLTPLFRKAARDLAGKTLTIDFRPFEYMNSATVAPILQFIKLLDAQRVRTTLLFDPAISWQRVNFQCMKTIARTLSHVSVMGLGADGRREGECSP